MSATSSILRAAWGASPALRRTAYGAGVGAIYGGFSDNNSIIGGAFKGALLANRANNKVGLGGAIVGGLYGAFSSGGTMLGGAAMGATLARGAAPFARTAYGMAKGASGFANKAKAVGYGLLAQGRASGRFMRNQMTQGYNTFNAIRSGGLPR